MYNKLISSDMMQVPNEKIIAQAAKMLYDAAPKSKVILFGSYARGDYSEHSDVDFMVVEPEVKARRDEMVRLLDVLRPLRIPVDVVVAAEDTYEKWSAFPGTVYYEAKLEGKLLHATE